MSVRLGAGVGDLNALGESCTGCTLLGIIGKSGRRSEQEAVISSGVQIMSRSPQGFDRCEAGCSEEYFL